MKLPQLRWATRTVIAVGELSLIAYIINLIFNPDRELNPEMTNALSVLVGGLLLNFGKTSGYFFSQESETIESNNDKKGDENASNTSNVNVG